MAWRNSWRQARTQVSLYAADLGPCVNSGIIWFLTLPYYRSYRFNTLSPIKRIAQYASQPQDTKTLIPLLTKWRARKLEELKFISIACAVLAAAVIGAFSWTNIEVSFWLAETLWYCCLVLSILGILLSAQQISILEILGPIPELRDPSLDSVINRYLQLLLFKTQRSSITIKGVKAMKGDEIWVPRWKMIFTWQSPMMFMSYSVLLFLGGVTLVVCTPLIRGDAWDGRSNTAVIYLGFCTFGAAVFVLCSFWIYHYVDLEAIDTESDSVIDGHVDSTSGGLPIVAGPSRPGNMKLRSSYNDIEMDRDPALQTDIN